MYRTLGYIKMHTRHTCYMISLKCVIVKKGQKTTQLTAAWGARTA